MRHGIMLAAFLALASTAGSAYADACSGGDHTGGSVMGAVGGGLIGNAITHGSGVGIVGGALVGGLAGNAIARDIDCGRGRHYDRRARNYYYYDRHGHRVYTERVVSYDRYGHKVYEERYVRRD